MIVASIDIGTNSVRLLVARLSEGMLERIWQERAILRLGRGVRGSGFLQKDKVDLALVTLRSYVQIAKERGAERILACATSAVREASNAPWFLELIRRETGLEVKVLSGWEEASWSMEGMKGVWKEVPPLWMGVDVGGGSTEMSVAKEESLMDARSIPLGMVSLTEEFFEDDPPTRESLEMGKKRARELLEGAIGELRFWKKGSPLVGTAGTVTTLAALENGMETYDGDAIHGSILHRDVVGRWVAKLSAMKKDVRATLPGMEPGREDVIVAGALIVEEVLEVTGAQELIVSDHGLLEGIARMAQKLGQPLPVECAADTRRGKGGMEKPCWTMI